jgi:hypothetical protein
MVGCSLARPRLPSRGKLGDGVGQIGNVRQDVAGIADHVPGPRQRDGESDGNDPADAERADDQSEQQRVRPRAGRPSRVVAARWRSWDAPQSAG